MLNICLLKNVKYFWGFFLFGNFTYKKNPLHISRSTSDGKIIPVSFNIIILLLSYHNVKELSLN